LSSAWDAKLIVFSQRKNEMLNWSKLEPLFETLPHKMHPAPEYNIPDSLKSLLEDYLLQPSSKRFLSLRDEIAASPHYAPYADYGAGVRPFMEKGDFEKAKDAVMAAMPGFLLNPGIHLYALHIYHELGREENARFEDFLIAMCIKGILSTGDGSKQQPYLVLSVTDEYDLLGFFKRRPLKQSLVDNNGRRCDCFDFEDGSQLWFDVDTPYMHQAKQFPKR
jgi:hypothetical protein